LLVFAVGIRVGHDCQPLPESIVALHRSVAESDLAESPVTGAILIERRVLPWRPAGVTKHVSATSGFEYTVGYSVGGQHIPWGLSFSTDRSVIETELAHVRAAIAESRAEGPITALVLERQVNPWFEARPRPTRLPR
jgi:hypothetical protein